MKMKLLNSLQKAAHKHVLSESDTETYAEEGVVFSKKGGNWPKNFLFHILWTFLSFI